MLPEKAQTYMRIPKTQIGKNWTPRQKREFDQDIGTIILIYSFDSSFLPETKNTKFVGVAQCEVKNINVREKNILLYFKSIPQKQVLVLKYEDNYKICAYYKKLYTTEWKKELDLNVTGTDLDGLYKNWLKEIIGGKWNDNISFDENISIKNQLSCLERKLKQTEKKRNTEPQPLKQRELHNETVCLKNEIEKLKSRL